MIKVKRPIIAHMHYCEDCKRYYKCSSNAENCNKECFFWDMHTRTEKHIYNRDWKEK